MLASNDISNKFSPVTIHVTFENEKELLRFRLMMSYQTTITDVMGGTIEEQTDRVSMMRVLLNATYP
jgi:hypothetical protein